MSSIHSVIFFPMLSLKTSAGLLLQLSAARFWFCQFYICFVVRGACLAYFWSYLACPYPKRVLGIHR